jgi:SAM-dependent methyltransferase
MGGGRSVASAQAPGGPQKAGHVQESAFHDAWALTEDPASIAVRAAFEGPTALENRFFLSIAGSLAGQRILDVGSGLGEAAVYFALCGARVTAVDNSPEMLAFARRLAALHGVEIDGLVSTAEGMTEVGAFDIVYCANVLHHLVDRDAFVAAAAKALRPGGLFFSWDPLAYNPAINMYRRMATDVRTEDERPLTFADVDRLRPHFVDVGHREFWVASLALFAKYFAWDRIHPNQDRYWKRILRETPRTLWWWRPLAVADRVLTRVPLVRRLAWNMAMWGRREATP